MIFNKLKDALQGKKPKIVMPGGGEDMVQKDLSGPAVAGPEPVIVPKKRKVMRGL